MLEEKNYYESLECYWLEHCIVNILVHGKLQKQYIVFYEIGFQFTKFRRNLNKFLDFLYFLLKVFYIRLEIVLLHLHFNQAIKYKYWYSKCKMTVMKKNASNNI